MNDSKMKELLAPDFSTRPWWADAMVTPILPAEVPAKVDVAVIGAGYTGMSAALAAARGGREVIVFEAGTVSSGCSARNGGQMSSSVRPEWEGLSHRFGEAAAQGIVEGIHASYNFVRDFTRAEGIDCDYAETGHFVAAHRPNRMKGLEAWAAGQRRMGHDVEVVSAADQARYVDTPSFHGGAIVRNWGALHPAKLLDGMIAKAQEAGVRIIENTRVDAVKESAGGMLLQVGGRQILARDVVVGTNGYTSSATPWLRRRLIPLSTYIVTTEALDPARVRALFPSDAMVFDTRKMLSYCRATPDGKHVLFGTRAPYDPANPASSVPIAHANLVRDFPALKGVKIGRGWGGIVGFTFDEMPHLGSRGHMHYAAGYCGRGIAMASWMGNCLGRRLAGEAAANPFDVAPMKTMPLYTGTPWFIQPMFAAYRVKDMF